MKDIRYHMPVKMLIGQNIIQRNFQALALGTKCLIVTGKSSAKKSGALDDVISALNEQKIEYKIFDEVGQNPYLSVCIRAAEMAVDFGADFIVGIGGGSPLDAAKAAAVLAANPGIDASALFPPSWKNHPLPIALVGTTAGTGSEVTPYAVVTVDEGHLKKSIFSSQIYPKVIFGDPRYTQGLSEKFTISTALDALTHCIEGYFNAAADPLSDLTAIEGIRLLLDSLKEIKGKKPEEIDLSVRESLYIASLWGGITIATTGTCFCHALGYFLSESHDVPHGIACAVYLPQYIDRAIKYCPHRADALFRAVSTSPEEMIAFLDTLYEKPILKLSALSIKEIAGRYPNTKNLLNSPGQVDLDTAISIMSNLFGE